MAHPCSTCGKSFQQDRHLHGHRVSSNSQTCKKCLYCDYSFVDKSSKAIKRHMKSKHSDFSCEMCNNKFFLYSGLATHMRYVHGVFADLQSFGNFHQNQDGTRRDNESINNLVYSMKRQHIQDAKDDKIRSSQVTINTSFFADLQACGNSLNRLLDEKVRQDPDKTRRCNEIVHHLVTFMQHNLECGVSEVVKGGSLGKGTSIKEKVDIDLVVFMKRFTSVADLQEQHEEVIKDLKKHILHDFTFAKQVHYDYDTKHSNRFHLRTDDEDLIQVDLLPACDFGGGSKKVFDEMAGLDDEARSYYSVSFAKDQVRFTKEKPELVKDVIRVIKHWKTREELNISSYTVEIITIKEWKRMGSPTDVDLDQLFERTMTKLCDIGSISITWSNSRKGFEQPIVMDPANPFNNTASWIGHSDQMGIARKAQEIVNRL